jgi:hypothetical protein
MAPGGKAFIIFNFPPGVSFCMLPAPRATKALRDVGTFFSHWWSFASRAVIDLKATATPANS